MIKSRSLNKQNKGSTEWKNVIQLLPCKSQEASNGKTKSTKTVPSMSVLASLNPDIPLNDNGISTVNTHNNTQKSIIEVVVSQENQKTSQHSKNSLLQPVLFSDSVGDINISPITNAERKGCQCECLLV